MFKNSIVGKLMILFFLVGIVSLSIIGIYSYQRAKKALLKRTLDQLTSIRIIKKNQVEFFFTERFNNISLLSQSGPLRKEMADIIKLEGRSGVQEGSFLSRSENALRSETIGFAGLYFLSQDGVLYHSTDSTWTVRTDPAYRAQMEQLALNIPLPEGLALTDLFFPAGPESMAVCLIGTGVNGVDGTKLGILAGEIRSTDIDQLMMEDDPENGLGTSGETYLVGSDRLMRSYSRFLPNSVLRTSVNTQSVTNAFSNETGSAIIDDYRTVPVLSSYTRLNIPGLNWVIMAEIDYQEAMIPIISIRNDLILISLVIALFILSLATLISRMITQPVIRLKNAAVRVGEGDFDVKLNEKSRDEIGVLSGAFETMAEQLKTERMQRMTALYDGQELERQRLSRELHDGLGQMLVALKMRLENLEPCEKEPLREEILGSFHTLIKEVRRVSYDLTPAGLYDFNIDMAIKALCDQVGKQPEITIEYSSFGNFSGCQGKVKNYLFRIAQEALHNALIHSRAGHVDVNLVESSGHIVMMIGDDGQGFDYSGDKVFSGNGIYNMRERCRILGGTFDIESAPGQGTTLRIKVPVKLP